MARYKLLEKIGQGGMGSVYRAVQQGLKREVAVKMLPVSGREDEEMLARFMREMKVVSQLSHPNIVRVFDYGELDGQLFYAMELSPGADLSEAGVLPFERVRRLMEQGADALAYLHARALFHRDIKPHNFVITEDDRLLLVDFGLARALDSTMLTEEGAVVGTLRFLPPEAILSEKTELGRAPADVYALAATAHELVRGQPAFHGSGLPGLVGAICRGPRPSLAGVAGVPAWFDALQQRALAIDPAARPTAAEYRDALAREEREPGSSETTLDGEPGGESARETDPRVTPKARLRGSALATPTTPPRRPASTRIAAAAAFALTFGLAVVVGSVVLRRAPSDPPGPSADPRSHAASGEASPVPALPAPTRAPAGLTELAARTLAVWPTERSVLVDMDVAPPGGREAPALVVEAGPWTTRAVRFRASWPAGTRFLHVALDGLPPDTDHFVRVRIADGPAVIGDHRVRTYGRTHEGALREMKAQLAADPKQAGVWAQVFHRKPDARCVPLFAAVARSHRAEDVSSFGKLGWVAQQLRNREMADALFPHVASMKDTGTRCELLRGCVAARHPEGTRRAYALLGELTRGCELDVGLRAAAQIGGAEACDRAAAAFDRVPHVADLAPLLAFVDRDRAHAHAARWLGMPRSAPPSPLVTGACALLEELGDGPAEAQLAVELARPDGEFDRAVHALAGIGGRASRDALVAAFATRPDHVTLLAAAARCGDRAFVPVLAPLGAGPASAARREALAAFAGVGGAEARDALRRALADADGESASLGAWGLAQLGARDDAATVPTVRADVLALARSPRDASGLAAWAAARLGGAAVAEFLAATLAAELAGAGTAPTGSAAGAPPLARIWGLARAVAECGGPAEVEKLRALAAGTGARGAREPLTRALQRLSERLAAPASSSSRAIALPASACWVRTGIRLEAGESVDVSVVGWWGPAGSAPVRADGLAPVSGQLPHLTATAVLGPERFRITRRPERILAKRACELLLTPWETPPAGASLAARPGLSGYAVVQIDR